MRRCSRASGCRRLRLNSARPAGADLRCAGYNPGVSTRAVLVGVLSALALAEPARAAEVTSWSQYGDEHDFITLGVSRVLHPGNAQALRAFREPWGDYGAYGRPLGGGDGVYLAFVQPEGQPLR